MSVSTPDPITGITGQDSGRDLAQIHSLRTAHSSHATMDSERSDSPLQPTMPPGFDLGTSETPIPLTTTLSPSSTDIKQEISPPEALIGIPAVSGPPSEQKGSSLLVRPGHPPIFNPNVAQQTPPGPQYSPRAQARARREEAENYQVNQYPGREVFQASPSQPRSFRPRAPTFYQQFTPPAYMFKLLGDRLKGLIMGCTDDTKDECLSGLVFGLPSKHWDYIKDVPEGTSVYLFNYTRRCLYGVFQSVGPAQWNLKPHGWSVNPRIPTRFPAQIKVEVVSDCPCLNEEEYGPILEWRQNYITFQKFSFELDTEQVQALNHLFEETKEAEPDREEPPEVLPPPPPHFQAYQPRPVAFQGRRGGGTGRMRGGGRNPGRGRRGSGSGGGGPNEAHHPIARRPPMTRAAPPPQRSPAVQPPPGMGLSPDTPQGHTPPPNESLI